MSKEYGFVYVLSNESMPGIYKIGFTMGHPKTRMEQLTSSTACPTPFELAGCIGVENPASIEKQLHEHLVEYRVNRSREFFKVPAFVIIDALEDFSDEHEDLVNINGLSRDQYQDEKNQNRQEQQAVIDYFHAQCADPIHWPKKLRSVGFSACDDEELPF